MGKKKSKIDDDLDFDFEDDDFGDFEDFSFGEPEAPPPKNAREAVTRSLKDGSKGFKASFTDNKLDTIGKIAKASVPRHLSSEVSELSNIYGESKDAILKGIADVKKSGLGAAKALNKLVPENSKMKNMLGSIIEKLNDEYKREKGPSKEELEQQAINAGILETLGEIKSADQANMAVKEAIDKQRHATSTQLLQNIYGELNFQRTFHNKVSTGYYRKSLELQYKSLFIQKSQLEVLVSSFGTFKNQFETIINNTALPDFIKARSKELFKQQFFQKGREDIINSFYKRFNPLENIKKNLIRNIKGVTEGITSGLNGVEEIASAGEMFDGMGMSKSYMAGQMAGDYVKDLIGRKIGDKIANTKLGKRYIYDIKNAMADPTGVMREAMANNRNSKTFLGSLKYNAASAIYGLTGSPSQNAVTYRREDLDAAVSFDNRAHTSLVKVIPGLLTKIYGEIKSQRIGGKPEDNEIYFNNKTDTFMSKKDIVKDIRSDVTNALNKNTSGYINNLINAYESSGVRLSPKHKEVFAKAIMKYMLSTRSSVNPSMIVSEGFLNSIEDHKLKNSLFRASKRLIKNMQDDPYLVDDVIWALSSIRNNLPNINSRFSDLHKSGMGDLLTSMGVAKYDKHNGNYIHDGEGNAAFIMSNWNGLGTELKTKSKKKENKLKANIDKGIGKVKSEFNKRTDKIKDKVNTGINTVKDYSQPYVDKVNENEYLKKAKKQVNGIEAEIVKHDVTLIKEKAKTLYDEALPKDIKKSLKDISKKADEVVKDLKKDHSDSLNPNKTVPEGLSLRKAEDKISTLNNVLDNLVENSKEVSDVATKKFENGTKEVKALVNSYKVVKSNDTGNKSSSKGRVNIKFNFANKRDLLPFGLGNMFDGMNGGSTVNKIFKRARQLDRKLWFAGVKGIMKMPGLLLKGAGKAISFGFKYLINPSINAALDMMPFGLGTGFRFLGNTISMPLQATANAISALKSEDKIDPKNRKGGWLSRLNIFAKDKDLNKKKGFKDRAINFLKENKGFTIMSGLMGITLLLKNMGISLDDVVSGVKIVGRAISSFTKGIASALSYIPGLGNIFSKEEKTINPDTGEEETIKTPNGLAMGVAGTATTLGGLYVLKHPIKSLSFGARLIEGIINVFKGKPLGSMVSWFLEKFKPKAISLVDKAGDIGNSFKKVKKIVTNPKVIKKVGTTAATKAAAKMTTGIAAAASGIGAILTVGMILWELGWTIYYMYTKDMSFIEALVYQLLGWNMKEDDENELNDDNIAGNSTTSKADEKNSAAFQQYKQDYNNAKTYTERAKATNDYLAKKNTAGMENLDGIKTGAKIVRNEYPNYTNSPYIIPKTQDDGKRADLININPSLKSALEGYAKDYYERTGKKLEVTSGYRDFNYQVQLWEKKARTKYTGNYEDDMRRAMANGFRKGEVAYPSPNSPHVKGTAIDLNISAMPNASSINHKTPDSVLDPMLSKWGLIRTQTNFHNPRVKQGLVMGERWHIQTTGTQPITTREDPPVLKGLPSGERREMGRMDIVKVDGSKPDFIPTPKQSSKPVSRTLTYNPPAPTQQVGRTNNNQAVAELNSLNNILNKQLQVQTESASYLKEIRDVVLNTVGQKSKPVDNTPTELPAPAMDLTRKEDFKSIRI